MVTSMAQFRNGPITKQTEEDILNSLESTSYSLSYADNCEIESDEHGRMEWKFKNKPDITTKGRRIVRADPNIGKDTMAKLMLSESRYISKEKISRLITRSEQEIYDEEFLSNNELGLAHVSQCILEDLDQCKADLVATYSDDRRLPFIIGAIYLNALLAKEGFFYYGYTAKLGYERIRWMPRTIYTDAQCVRPPHKKKDFKKYYDPDLKTDYTLPECPLCGSYAKMCRAGLHSRFWHVCCTDPKGECVNYYGTDLFRKEQEAANKWISYCKHLQINTE